MKELLFSVTGKDFIIDWYSGTGAGGQHRNKHQNCCRMKHPDSGAEATGTESRSREQNRTEAFRRLVASDKFRMWLRKKSAETMMTAEERRREEEEKRRREEEIERAVDEQMKEENIKVEYI